MTAPKRLEIVEPLTPAPEETNPPRSFRSLAPLALLLALHWTPLAWLALPLALLSIALALPGDWSLLRRVVVAYPLFGCAAALVAHIYYFLGSPVSVWPVTALSLLALVARPKALGPIVNRRDLIPSLLALFTALLFAPTLLSYHFHIPLIAFGEDAISHFAIFENLLEQRGLLFGRTDILGQILRELANYPQSSHLHAVTTYLYLFGETFGAPARLITFFSSYQIALTVLMMMQLGYLFEESSRDTLFAKTCGASVLALLGAGFVVGYLNFYGFYSQIAAYVVLLALLQLLHSAELHPSPRTLTYAFIVESGVAATWFFLSPISYLLLAAWTVRNRASYSTKRLAAMFLLNGVLNLLFVSLPYINLDPIRYLNFSGAVDALPLALFASTGAAAFLYFFFSAHADRRSAHFLIAALFTISSIFAGGVYLYQLVTHGSITYYFHKSLYTTALPLLIAAGCGIAAYVGWLARGRTIEARAALIALSGAGLCFAMFQLNAPVMNRFLVERPTFLKREVYAELLKLGEVPGIRSRVIFPLGQEPYETHVMTRWLPSIVGSQIWREHYRSPLAFLGSYQAEVARYVSVTKFRRRPVIFDPRATLRAECNRVYFELRRKKRLAILPASSAAWDSERCGTL